MYKHQHYTPPKAIHRDKLLTGYNHLVNVQFTCKEFLHPLHQQALEAIIDELGWQKDIASKAGVKP